MQLLFTFQFSLQIVGSSFSLDFYFEGRVDINVLVKHCGLASFCYFPLEGLESRN